MKSTLATLLLLASFATASSAQNTDEQILRLEQAQLEATVKGDSAALSEFMAEDYFEVGPSGETMSYGQALDTYKSGVFASAKIESAKIRSYGNVAVVNGVFLVRFVKGESDLRFRYTNVWVNSSGTWKMVSAQTTRVKP
jgi:hypothetical protein